MVGCPCGLCDTEQLRASCLVDVTVTKLGLWMPPEAEVLAAVNSVLSSGSKLAENYLRGDDRAVGGLVGLTLKVAKAADPADVRRLLQLVRASRVG